MKHNTKIVLLSAAGALLTAGNALAAGDLMNNAVNSLDPVVQPWAQTAVTILRAGFVLCVSGGSIVYVAHTSFWIIPQFVFNYLDESETE